MTPEIRHIGTQRQPVVVADDFIGDVDAVIDLAASLAPFRSPSGNFYPGLRQPIDVGTPAFGYAERLLRKAAPIISETFQSNGFYLIEASFSMVTTLPGALIPPQRGPHFDSADPNYVAVMHYLSETPGTAFYRQRGTGIEMVDHGNVQRYIDCALTGAGATSGYIHGSTPFYEQIGQVEGRRDRLAIYRGAMLHSGIIPPDATFSADPREGRLTCNIFIQLRR